MNDIDFINKTKQLIDNLKSVCANYGLGNDGNEYKIISQVFLYKFINDKFIAVTRTKQPKLKDIAANKFATALEQLSDNEYQFLLGKIGNEAPKLKPQHLISYLFNNQNQADFAKTFDDTLRDISITNTKYSVQSSSGEKDKMFDELSQFINDSSARDNFCRALISKLVDFSFENMFQQKYDFFATIFEYLIKDYNSDSGGKYAEYYTPHAVARIMANILVDTQVSNVSCYDPSAGSGTLLMSLAHAIGEQNCAIYSEDISQKSSTMLRLNLILNNLPHSINNIIKNNTILTPYYLNRKFDYIVSNPPFKLDFSDFRDDLATDSNKSRFFAGIPNIPKSKKESMAIYLLFIQHIMFSLSAKGKAAVVVPTGFITAQSGIEKKIRTALIDHNMLAGVVSMPSNIFASTGTNVSVLFLDKQANAEKIILIDASKLGETVKDGKNQRTVLTTKEENKIINTFKQKEKIEDFSVVLTANEIKEKNYSFSAGQYFDIKIEYVDISAAEFQQKMQDYQTNLDKLFAQSSKLEQQIKQNLKGLKYE